MSQSLLEIQDLTMAYGETVIQKDLNFTVSRGDIFIIMGGSGCGKSTLLRHLIGLKAPAAGRVLFDSRDFWSLDDTDRSELLRRTGVMYQYSALWSEMTLAENVAFPLEEYSSYSSRDIREIALLKLRLVGLGETVDLYPSQVSGGMKKRAALARALALDPEIVFLDEPSSGLDPLSSRNLDELVSKLREALGATFVIVTHELASIFAIGTNSVFLDPATKTMIASGDPKQIVRETQNPSVLKFLTRGVPENRERLNT